MTVTIGGPGMQYSEEKTRLFARGRAFLKGEVGLAHSVAATGVNLLDSSGPRGSQGAVSGVADFSMEARKHAIQLIAREDIAQDQMGTWKIEGREFALVKFAADATYEAGTACVLSAVDDDCELQAKTATITERVKAKLAAQVVVTDFATSQYVEIVLEGRHGF